MLQETSAFSAAEPATPDSHSSSFTFASRDLDLLTGGTEDSVPHGRTHHADRVKMHRQDMQMGGTKVAGGHSITTPSMSMSETIRPFRRFLYQHLQSRLCTFRVHRCNCPSPRMLQFIWCRIPKLTRLVYLTAGFITQTELKMRTKQIARLTRTSKCFRQVLVLLRECQKRESDDSPTPGSIRFLCYRNSNWE